jgi:hypothetical protein
LENRWNLMLIITWIFGAFFKTWKFLRNCYAIFLFSQTIDTVNAGNSELIQN